MKEVALFAVPYGYAFAASVWARTLWLPRQAGLWGAHPSGLVLLLRQVLLETNTAGNLQLVVQVAKEYTEQLGAGKIMELLEAHKSYHGLYYYLGGHIAFSEDPEVRLSVVCCCLFPGGLCRFWVNFTCASLQPCSCCCLHGMICRHLEVARLS